MPCPSKQQANVMPLQSAELRGRFMLLSNSLLAAAMAFGLLSRIQTPFKYLYDPSPFGKGTLPRSNLSFSRICDSAGYFPCPFSDTVAINILEGGGSDGNFTSFSQTFPYGYDTSIPRIITEIYSSGTSNDSTISNYFDIQWRRYYTSSDPMFNNGSAYLISAFRTVQSLVANDKILPVEGLIVDMTAGGVGLRNHTFPPGFQYGVTWSEDLLFVEPETVCVNTNMNIDYTISPAPSSDSSLLNLVITDRGGFINLSREFPKPNTTNPQANPDLRGRAYQAAWLINAYTALYYNVTDDANTNDGIPAFSYLNSAINQTFPLPLATDQTNGYTNLVISQDFNQYFSSIEGVLVNSTNPAASSAPPNPFNVQAGNFSTISALCETAGPEDVYFANITNILVTCGYVQGAPQRQDPGSILLFGGSVWSQPLYACASAVKATIKTVTLVYNGTDDSLEDLIIVSVQDKKYPNGQLLPLWGVENTGNAYTFNNLQTLVWGLVSNEWENVDNVSTVRQESLYVPGSGADDILTTFGSDNMPGTEAFISSMGPTYDVDTVSESYGSVDYTGITDLSMWIRWQKLSSSADSASLIPNLIWTDTAASAVVGTKGVLGPGITATDNLVPIMVTPTVQVIKYHYPYAIPAFLVALMLLLITAGAISSIILGISNVARLRLQLQQTSPGRILTTFLYPEPAAMTMKSKKWARKVGKNMIDVSHDSPVAADVILPPEESLGRSDYKKSGSETLPREAESFLGGENNEREIAEGNTTEHSFSQQLE